MVSLNQFLKILCPIVLETCFAYTMTLLEKLGGGGDGNIHMQLNSNILSECLLKYILFSEVKDKDKKRIYFSPSGCNSINSLNSSSRSLKYNAKLCNA